MSEKNQVRISISGGGLSYKSNINPEIVPQIMELCLNRVSEKYSAIAPENKVLQSQTITSTIKESAAEYLQRFGPKSNPDKILTFGIFIKNVEKRDSFNPGEIRRFFRDAGEIVPANFARDLRKSINNGWIAKDNMQKGNFYVTNSGLKAFEAGFTETKN